MKTTEMVADFHKAFGIENNAQEFLDDISPKSILVRDCLNGIGDSMIQNAKKIKLLCQDMKERDIDPVCVLRAQLMLEELGEVLVAIGNNDRQNLLHELADLRYVVDGTAVAFKLGDVLEEAVVEIHRANMSKLDKNGQPVIDAAGRVVKSDQFKPADVRPLLSNSLKAKAGKHSEKKRDGWWPIDTAPKAAYGAERGKVVILQGEHAGAAGAGGKGTCGGYWCPKKEGWVDTKGDPLWFVPQKWRKMP